MGEWLLGLDWIGVWFFFFFRPWSLLYTTYESYTLFFLPGTFSIVRTRGVLSPLLAFLFAYCTWFDGLGRWLGRGGLNGLEVILLITVHSSDSLHKYLVLTVQYMPRSDLIRYVRE